MLISSYRTIEYRRTICEATVVYWPIMRMLLVLALVSPLVAYGAAA